MQGVVFLAAMQNVVASAAEELIGLALAAQFVIASIAIDRVVPKAAPN